MMDVMQPLELSPDELLTTTRAVRKRLDLNRPVPLEVIRECLEIALQAPTGSNAQGWQWIVITDPELRRRIGEIYEGNTQQYLATKAPSADLYAGDPSRIAVQDRVSSSAAWLGEHIKDVPVLVLACIRAGNKLPVGNQAGLWGSLLPGVWSYMLAARARGLGTAWTTLHMPNGGEQQVAELLGLPANVHQGALIPTAYYTGDTFKRASRVSLDSVLHVNGW
jgi:nitroreductase